MKVHITTLVTGLVLAIPITLPAWATRGDDGAEDYTEIVEVPAVERWQRMSQAERHEMERRFEKFRQLPEEKRQRLQEQSQRFETRRQRSEGWLTDSERESVDKLSPEQRRRVLREFFRHESLVDGERVRAKLPRELLQRLEEAEPLERGQILEEFRQTRRRASGQRLLDYLAREAGATTEQRLAWGQMPKDEQSILLMRLGRSFVRGRVLELGPPGELSAQDWERLDRLRDPAFFDAWQRLQPSAAYHPGRSKQSNSTEGSSTAEADPDASESVSPVETPETVATPETAEPKGARPEPAKGTKREWLRVRALAGPTIDELIEFADTPVRERRAVLAARGRERVLRYLRMSELVSPEELAEFEGFQGRRFIDRMRELVVANAR